MNEPRGFLIKDGDILLLSTNPFKFLYEDAISLQQASQNATVKDSEVRYARNSVLLFVVGMEALINRVYDTFVRTDLPAFVREKISDLPLDMKWYLAPIWCGNNEKETSYKVDEEPFQSFRELVKIRNSYVHPFPKKMALKIVDAKRKFVDYDDPSALLWPQTKIPKDLNHFDKNSALKAREVVDAMVELLDQFLSGKIKKDNWWLTETINKEP